MKIYTLGHSTRSFEDFFDILKHYSIELVVDVRRFPSSKKFPWFGKENLEQQLPKNQIHYIHFPELGGFRKEGYEAFTESEEFSAAIKKLLESIDDKNAAILCAEILWWRCHRRYIAKKLVELGNEVIHVFDKERTQEHKIKNEDVKQKMNLKIFCDKIRNEK